MGNEKRKDSRRRALRHGEYQRSNGSYEYKWTDAAGRRHSAYARTLEELRDKEAGIVRDTLDGIRTDKKNLTVNDLYEKWAGLKRGIRNTTFQDYRCLYARLIAPDIGKARAAGLKKSDVRAFYGKLIDERGLAASTLANVHKVLHQILNIGVDDGYMRQNPADGALDDIRKENADAVRSRRALTAEEQERFESFLARSKKFRRWRPIFTTLLWTGMRVGEATALTWQDVDMETGTISVRRSLAYYAKGPGRHAEFSINLPKTKAGMREIPMLSKVRHALMLEKELQDERHGGCTASVDGVTGFVFANSRGGLQHCLILNRALSRIIRACNEGAAKEHGGSAPVLLPQFTCHSLRHTFATRMCEAGVNLKAMQDILGHSTVKMTLDVYTEATEKLKRSEIAALESHFGGGNGDAPDQADAGDHGPGQIPRAI